MKIVLVVAMAQNRVIGRDGGLPWRLPEDLRHFRDVTMGRPMIMGRRTWESIGRVLPGRCNIVVSSSETRVFPEGVQHVRDLEAAFALAREVAQRDGVDECMVIGGAEIYRQALPRADCIELTLIERDVEGDTFFPELDTAAWIETTRCAGHSASDPDLGFWFLTLERASSSPDRGL